MGMLMIKVGETWVPYVPAGTVGPPAYAGPSSGAVTDALFRHLSAPGWSGFSSDPTGKWQSATATRDGNFGVYERNVANNGYDLLGYTDRSGATAGNARMGNRSSQPTWARFGRVGNHADGGWIVHDTGLLEASVAPGQAFRVYDLSGNHICEITAAEQRVGVWILKASSAHASAPQFTPNGWAEASEFVLLAHSSSMILNGCSRTGDNVSIRVGNVQKASFGNYNTFSASLHEFTGGQVRGKNQSGGVNYYDWGTISWSNPGGQGFMGIHAENTAACAFRIYPGQGEAMYAVNSANNQHTPVGGSAWHNISSVKFKKDVRSLRPERDRIVVQLESRADEVEPPDIMGLKPTVFRPKVPALRPIKDADGEWTETEEYSEDTIIGFESRRERLGLIAEEVQYVIPSAVVHDEDGEALAIDYAQVTVALLDHVQRLTETVETLRYRIAELEGSST